MGSQTCEKCQKNKATYHLTSIEAGKKVESHLCGDCASQHGIKFIPSGPKKDSTKSSDKESKDSEACPTCGMTLGDIKRKMRIGCSTCYEKFKPELKDILKRVHGSNEHIGKVPAGAPKKIVTIENMEAQIVGFKKELESAIKAEMYEHAATLRDKIKAIEAKLKEEAVAKKS